MNNQNQLWALYLGSLSAFGPKLDLKTIKQNRLWKNIKNSNYELPEQIIFGVPAISSDKLDDISLRDIKEYVSIYHNVSNSSDLYNRVHKLINNPDQDLIRIIQQTKLMNYAERAQMLKNAKGSKSKPMLDAVIANLDSLPKNNIYAYYLSNAITLCRLGGFLGLLSPDEVLNEVNAIAKVVHDNYRNYEEFALGCRIGFKIHRVQLILKDLGFFFLNQSKVMLDLSCLVWPHLPWPEKY